MEAQQASEAFSAPAKAERKRPERKVHEFDDCLGYYEEWRANINFQIELLAEIEKLKLQESIPDAPHKEGRQLPADHTK